MAESYQAPVRGRFGLRASGRQTASWAADAAIVVVKRRFIQLAGQRDSQTGSGETNGMKPHLRGSSRRCVLTPVRKRYGVREDLSPGSIRKSSIAL